MGKQAAVVLSVLVMVGVIVGVDVLFLKHEFAERLIVNIAIVALFGTLYLRFLKHS